MTFDPYAPPRADGAAPDDAVPGDSALERARLAAVEGHVSAIGVVAYLPAILLVFFAVGVIRAGRDSTWKLVALVTVAATGALIAFVAHRIRTFRRDGRLALTALVSLNIAGALFTGLSPGAIGLSIPQLVAVFYLWRGAGAQVFTDGHARALAATRDRPIPTATWGRVLFGVIAGLWAVTGIVILTRS